ncbi:transmembrane protein [Ceratobasidium sp. AG-Ba]|nr:transmembrane protein [Ceratobasidium sp. AG-Ba]QRV99466.1 transmembrane protein [Ceratobasidium sp. AG-Ba]QRW13977.1 transmembrane protein [Ceratobasidium sp. AG-Ba]
MSQTTSGKNMAYDEGLLAHAPQVSKSQRQEGYDADILNPAPAPTRTPPLAHNERPADVESGSSHPLVVIAAAVGGGVGGALARQRDSSNSLVQPSSATPSAGATTPPGATVTRGPGSDQCKPNDSGCSPTVTPTASATTTRPPHEQSTPNPGQESPAGSLGMSTGPVGSVVTPPPSSPTPSELTRLF